MILKQRSVKANSCFLTGDIISRCFLTTNYFETSHPFGTSIGSINGIFFDDIPVDERGSFWQYAPAHATVFNNIDLESEEAV